MLCIATDIHKRAAFAARNAYRISLSEAEGKGSFVSTQLLHAISNGGTSVCLPRARSRIHGSTILVMVLINEGKI